MCVLPGGWVRGAGAHTRRRRVRGPPPAACAYLAWPRWRAAVSPPFVLVIAGPVVTGRRISHMRARAHMLDGAQNWGLHQPLHGAAIGPRSFLATPSRSPRSGSFGRWRLPRSSLCSSRARHHGHALAWLTAAPRLSAPDVLVASDFGRLGFAGGGVSASFARPHSARRAPSGLGSAPATA